jgi:DNA (cytosine-5)-methyltransferase 1
MIRHLDLFAGIGGFSQAVHWLGGTTVAFVEWDPWCRSVLAKHWPEATYYGDIKKVTTDDLLQLGPIDLITGGYPCQPFSLAGKRYGKDDPRHLWPEMRRVINTVRPRFVLAENVSGHISMGLDTVLTDLEADNYTARAIVVPAAGVNALHKRERVWIMAHANSDRSSERRQCAPVTGKGDQRRDIGSGGDRDTWEVTDGGTREDTTIPYTEGHLRGVSGNGGSIPPDRTSHQSPVAHTEGGTRIPDAHGTAVDDRGNARLDGPGRSSRQPEREPAPTLADATAPRRAPRTGETGRTVRDGARRPEPERRSGTGRGIGEGQTSRTLDTGPDGIPPGLVRRSSIGSAWDGWDDPATIRGLFRTGAWESELARVVTEETDRRQKLQAAGNAIVPLVAYEILRVMLEDA